MPMNVGILGIYLFSTLDFRNCDNLSIEFYFRPALTSFLFVASLQSCVVPRSGLDRCTGAKRG